MRSAGQLSTLRRAVGYSLGSIVAAVTSVAAFSAAYDWGNAGPVLASAAGFVGGCIPNYILNRRWAWPDRRSEARIREATSYALVALVSFVVSAVATRYAEHAAAHLTDDHGWRVAMVATAFLAVSGMFFVAKFVIYHRLVFIGGPAEVDPGEERGQPGATAWGRRRRTAERWSAPPTTSTPPPGRSGIRT